jgi:GMP synthase (glutamine-hydrolysing)
MICIIACGSEKIKFIEAALGELGKNYETISLEETVNTDFEKYSGVIISGSPILLIEDTEHRYIEQFGFLKSYNKPVLGICFGHQVLGLVYGASISIGDSIKGLEKINVLEQSPLFSGIENFSEFDQNHKEHTTVPVGFKLVANSQSCANEAMQHKTKPLYGVQFHPETSGEVGKRLLKNFVTLCL